MTATPKNNTRTFSTRVQILICFSILIAFWGLCYIEKYRYFDVLLIPDGREEKSAVTPPSVFLPPKEGSIYTSLSWLWKC